MKNKTIIIQITHLNQLVKQVTAIFAYILLKVSV